MIPDYQTLMLPVLERGASGQVRTRDVAPVLADAFGLTPEERDHLLPSGKQRTFDNRVHWAKTYLKQAGLLSYPRRGAFVATEEGQRVLAQKPSGISNAFLKRYDSFRSFQTAAPLAAPSETTTPSDDTTPDEVLRAAHRTITAQLADDLRERVRAADPPFFERVIVDLLLAMGYGGASDDPGRTLGKTGDNGVDGVDGVIDQDALGVDQLYVQAKRYAAGNNVGAGDIRDFFGALNLKKAQKGLFFTTSAFSPGAVQTARDLGMRIVLIDGDQLARLMVKYDIGCRTEEVVRLKEIDEGFFDLGA